MSQQTEAVAIIRPMLHHTTLKTMRLQAMIAWYGTVVGMTVNHQFPGGAWLTNDEANHRIAFLCTPVLVDDPDKLTHTGIHHIAFEYASLGELLDTYARLAPLDIVPHGSLDHGMTTSLYYQDPDGNSVELQADNFGDWQASSAWMRTAPQFAANPIGVPIDPAQLLAASRVGASPAELHERAYRGEFPPAQPLDLRLPS